VIWNLAFFSKYKKIFRFDLIQKYFLLLLILSLFLQVFFRVDALSSNVMDLGIFANNFSNVSDEWGRSIYGHFQPLMNPWGLVYKVINPNIAIFILVIFQLIALLVSVELIRRFFGILPALAMLLYYPFWVLALFDFHFDHLVVPVLTVFFILCKKRQFIFASLVASSLVLIKEPFSLQVSCCGLYFFWLSWGLRNEGHSKKLLTLGAVLSTWGLFWFYISIHIILPYSSGESIGAVIDSEAYSWLGEGILNKLQTLIFSPEIWLQEILNTPSKLKLLLIIFGSLAFIPLLKPAPLIVAFSPLLIMLLSKEPFHYDYSNHYTAGIIVPMIISFNSGLNWSIKFINNSDIKFIYKNKLTLTKFTNLIVFSVLIASHSYMASSPISRLFWSDKVWSYSWKSYIPSERDKMIKESLTKYIPKDKNLSVSSQNSLNWSHLSNRKIYLPFPQGVFEPHSIPNWSQASIRELLAFPRSNKSLEKETHLVDYVVLDLNRPLFIIDRGCNLIFGKCMDEKISLEYYLLVDKVKKYFDIVFEKDGFLILQRSYLKDENV
jgi:uncharacterized membrane protein